MYLYLYSENIIYTFSVPGADNETGGGGKGNCIS